MVSLVINIRRSNCVSMRQANASILREIPLIPTVSKILHNMKSIVVLNKLNLRIWYYWIKLEESSMESLYTKAFTNIKDWLLINIRKISANGFTNVSRLWKTLEHFKIVIHGYCKAEQYERLRQDYLEWKKNNLR